MQGGRFLVVCPFVSLVVTPDRSFIWICEQNLLGLRTSLPSWRQHAVAHCPELCCGPEPRLPRSSLTLANFCSWASVICFAHYLVVGFSWPVGMCSTTTLPVSASFVLSSCCPREYKGESPWLMEWDSFSAFLWRNSLSKSLPVDFYWGCLFLCCSVEDVYTYFIWEIPRNPPALGYSLALVMSCAQFWYIVLVHVYSLLLYFWLHIGEMIPKSN